MDRDRLYRGQQNSESAVALNRRATALFSSTNYFPKPPNPSRTERGATADRQPRLFHCHFLPGAVGPCRCRSPPLRFDCANQTPKIETEERTMFINLRDFYPYYTCDAFVEVSDEIGAVLLESKREEKNYIDRLGYHKAYYSLDRGDGIENDAVDKPMTPEDAWSWPSCTPPLPPCRTSRPSASMPFSLWA